MLSWDIKRALKRQRAGKLFTGPVSVTFWFFRRTRRAVDADNLLKQALDSCNGTAWKDDAQVISIIAHKRFDAEHPRTVIQIEEAPAHDLPGLGDLIADRDRTPEVNQALDSLLAVLEEHDFRPPRDDRAGNRDALASALVQAAIDHEIRIRVDPGQ
jgi:hypothetical protein